MSRAFDCRTLHAEPFSVGSPRVLYASDLSARSEGALRAAALLANRVEGQLTIGHVLPPRAASHVRTGAQKRLRRYAATAPLRAGSVLAFAIRSGSVSKTVAQLATETDAGMIVMGCQTRRPLAALFGTTAERVVRLAGRPALIVNSKAACATTSSLSPPIPRTASWTSCISPTSGAFWMYLRFPSSASLGLLGLSLPSVTRLCWRIDMWSDGRAQRAGGYSMAWRPPASILHDSTCELRRGTPAV